MNPTVKMLVGVGFALVLAGIGVVVLVRGDNSFPGQFVLFCAGILLVTVGMDYVGYRNRRGR